MNVDDFNSPVRIKVCCIKNIEEARTAIRYGASALGLVSAMPSGPGVIDETVIAKIAAAVPPPIATFLLTSAQDPDIIIAQQRRCGVNTLQLVDVVELDAYGRLRQALPGVALVQVLHVTGPETIAEAYRIDPYVDALLLDSGNPTLAIKELGGTGRTHNWVISHEIRAVVTVPIFLAGGLRATNAAEAIHAVAPFGLDLCSGVRTNDLLDENKLAAFFAAVNRVTSNPQTPHH